MVESGRHVRLRSVWGNPWEFESPRAHKIMSLANIFCEARAPHLHAVRERFERRSHVLTTVKTDEPGSQKIQLDGAGFIRDRVSPCPHKETSSFVRKNSFVI